ncbi:hypothetical protein BDF14DRAFT_1786662 [Spinellus fusiger]|nr:hypothetical protein BDF14DRAFT_1786662 [Spinellus fusiger]
MRSNSFPVEILEIIAQHLGYLDYIECVQVNTTWTILFTHLLYKHVLIKTQRQFKLFYRTLLHTASFQSQGLGYLVEHLTVERTVGFTCQELNRLTECCPTLRSIDFNPHLWRYLHSPSKLNTLKYIERLPVLNKERNTVPLIKKLGHQLTQLQLEGVMLSKWLKDRRLGFVLHFAPNLRRLDLTGEMLIINGWNFHGPHLTLDDMELIHSTCPHMEYLRLSVVQLQSRELTKNTAFFPANAMRILYLQDSSQSHWETISYFVHKYPHLEEFFWTGFFLGHAGHSVPHYLDPQSNENLYMTMAHQWHCLRSFIVSGIPERVWPGKRFFEALQSSGVSLTTLKLDFHKTPGDRFDGYSNFMALLNSSRDTLRTLSFKAWRGSHLSSLLCFLGQCQHLTSLSISGDTIKTVFELDLILDACPLLKSLSLSTGRLTLSGEYHEKNSPEIHHHLSEISILYLILDVHDITYHLSLRCPRLSSLFISNVENEQVFPDCAVEINMPNHTFDSLQIKNVRCSRLHSDYERRTSPEIALLSLSLLKRLNTILRRRDSPEIGWYRQEDNEKSVEQSMTRWYYDYKEYSDEDRGDDARRLYRLPLDEVFEASGYGISLETWDQRFWDESIKGKKQWRQSISRGFIFIRCQDVVRLSFNGTFL